MNIWRASSIEETPELELTNWQIIEVDSDLWPGKTRHFVGYNITEREGRVSSEIQVFDKQNMCGRTRSGRVYKLVGPPGGDLDAIYVWDFWKKRNQITSEIRVTDEMLVKHEEI